jgi:hypothetical protein
VEAGGAHWLEEAKEDLTTAAKVEPQNKEIRVELQVCTPPRSTSVLLLNMLMPAQLNSFTHLRALLVVHGRGKGGRI